MHKKRILTISGGIFCALLLTMGVWLGYIAHAYGYHALSPSLAAFKIRENNRAIYITSVSSLTEGVVIFPANLVSPWQYQDLASHIATTGKSVIIVKPALRFSSVATIDSSVLKRMDAKRAITHWTFIGHSAGATSACRSAERFKGSVSVILMNGYCKNGNIEPDVALLGKQDRLINSTSHNSQSKKTHVVENAGHFTPTDQEISVPAHTVLVKELLDELNR